MSRLIPREQAAAGRGSLLTWNEPAEVLGIGTDGMAERAAVDVEVVPVAGWVEPAAVWTALERGRTHLVWSDRSTAPDDRVSFIGFPGDDARLVQGRSAPGVDGLAELTETLRAGLPRIASPRLGWWGWIGYELGHGPLRVDAEPSDQPEAAFLLAVRGVEFDHDRRSVRVVALAGDRAWAEATAARIAAAPVPAVPEPLTATASWRLLRDDYLRRIDACLAAITRGDAYQICLTDRVTVRARTPFRDTDVFLRFRRSDRAEHAGLLRFGAWALVSGSPERFLRVDARGVASTKPIKGTRPRGRDAAEDVRFEDALRSSEKERAENLMIVDLMRNDLSRVAEVGSVEVTRLFDVERNAAVHHLVSTVRARLVGDAIGAIPALFPAGSMTGAPKRSAMQLLAGLEGGPRGVYSGAWGRIGGDGTLDLAVVIRSAVLHGATATVGAGGGITALSVPEEEWDEVVLKAAPMLAALGAA